MIKLALVSGSWPPEACGVGDYTAKVAIALSNLGVNVTRIGDKMSGYNGIIRSMILKDFDIIHIQYPSMGYGRSLSPAMIPLVKRGSRVCVTIHEFSNFHVLRRPWFLTFAHIVDARVFTNEDEKNIFQKIMRPKSGSDYVIPIASNIGKGSGVKIPGSVCNFGLITPNKGIEEFIQLASLAENSRELSFALIGAKTEMYGTYAENVINECRKRGVATHINLPDDALAELLSTFEFAYLPFPDGASSKRGSLLALQNNGVRILTTHTHLTPENIRSSTTRASSPNDAKVFLEETVRNNDRIVKLNAPELRDDLSEWGEIATRYLAIYEKML